MWTYGGLLLGGWAVKLVGSYGVCRSITVAVKVAVLAGVRGARGGFAADVKENRLLGDAKMSSVLGTQDPQVLPHVAAAEATNVVVPVTSVTKQEAGTSATTPSAASPGGSVPAMPQYRRLGTELGIRNVVMWDIENAVENVGGLCTVATDVEPCQIEEEEEPGKAAAEPQAEKITPTDVNKSPRHGWVNELPSWILEDGGYAHLRQGPRHTLQTIANRCDAPPKHRDGPQQGELVGSGALFVCYGGDLLIKTCGCSRSTFWTHLRKLVEIGFVVQLATGDGHAANVYGIPGFFGELDPFKVKNPGSVKETRLWTREKTAELKSLLSVRPADESLAVQFSECSRPVFGVQPSDFRTLPSSLPSLEPAPCMGGGAAEELNNNNDTPSGALAGNEQGHPTASPDHANADSRLGIAGVLLRAGVSLKTLKKHIDIAISHNYTPDSLNILWESVKLQSGIRSPVGLFLIKISSGERASLTSDITFEGPDADLHQAFYNAGILQPERDSLISESSPQLRALNAEYGIPPSKAIRECLDLYAGDEPSINAKLKALHLHLNNVCGILADNEECMRQTTKWTDIIKLEEPLTTGAIA